MTSFQSLPSFRRQQLLLEFTALKHHCPDGVYLSLNSGDPASWSGVIFVREGPYASAVLRFEILFPSLYPQSLPLIIFPTEIFHPLLVPLTTYSFSGGVDPSSTHSASDADRLPPGAFNLKHGFPSWTTAQERGRTSQRQTGDTTNMKQGENEALDSVDTTSHRTSAETKQSARIGHSPIVQILEYLKSAFVDPTILDALPLEAAGNPSAWHAWRSYRRLSDTASRPTSPTSTPAKRSSGVSRNPADWNWDGLWEARARNGIEESISDVNLFGSKNSRNLGGISDTIKFLHLDDKKLEDVQTDMLRLHGLAAEAATK